MTFGQKLKVLRRKLELTQSELSQLLCRGDADGSPTKRTVEDWEADRRTPMLITQEGTFARMHAFRPPPAFRDMPLYGEVPAGPLSDNPQLPDEFISVPVGKYPTDAFALKVRGDSMIGKGIHEGDLIVVQKREAVTGDVVVALIDGETTLKTLVHRNGKCELRSENAKRKDPVLTDQSAIQAVMIGKLPKERK